MSWIFDVKDIANYESHIGIIPFPD